MLPILIVHHAPSANTQMMLNALEQGVLSSVSDNDLVSLPAAQCCADDVLAASAVLIFTTENFGYMSGMIKDFFDRCFHRLDGPSAGKPYTLCIRAGSDGTGARRSIDAIVGGLAWKKAVDAVIAKGDFQNKYLSQCQEQAQTLACGIEMGIF